jgi:hypothetical protein
MKPLVLHMPDALRDALESALAEYMPEISHDIDSDDYEPLGAIIARHLMRSEKGTEVGEFLGTFQQAFLDVLNGTGNPAMLLENLPPTHGRLVMYGLAALIDHHSISSIIKLNFSEMQAVHQDALYRDLAPEKLKPIQFIYCAHRGKEPQPTVFVTADEIIDRMAVEVKNTDFATARAEIIEKLERVCVKSSDQKIHPFLLRNPAYNPSDSVLKEAKAPEFSVFNNGGELNDELTRIGVPAIDAENQAYYKKYAKMAERCTREFAAVSEASTKDNTLVLWHDLLTHHARGPVLTGQSQEGRKAEALTATIPTATNNLEFAAGPPYLRIPADHPVIGMGRVSESPRHLEQEVTR